MFETTSIKDLFTFKPKVFKDSRGYLFESYNTNSFQQQGLNYKFVQDNRSYSTKGTLRGLHFQKNVSAQAKLVTVLRGHVFDVAVDLRPSSETFGKWFGIHLNGSDPQFVIIPRGFAHGFLVLSDEADFFYKVDNLYAPEGESGIRFDDPDLKIKWPIDGLNILISEKDLALPSFANFKNNQGSK